ncbi:MAG: phosphoribosylformylglycinamidine synthase subunit PurQ [Clostridiales bacterium]|jgi:phosphoribosylformylglycinamidine synthase|nr:phosphoribosylformylglycinamidine synthase subunit PurQ [Clostridiales bacterium]
MCITSPDGRVLGKMAHNERVAAGLMRNISNVNDQGLFQAGVRYYS